MLKFFEIGNSTQSVWWVISLFYITALKEFPKVEEMESSDYTQNWLNWILLCIVYTLKIL